VGRGDEGVERLVYERNGLGKEGRMMMDFVEAGNEDAFMNKPNSCDFPGCDVLVQVKLQVEVNVPCLERIIIPSNSSDWCSNRSFSLRRPPARDSVWWDSCRMRRKTTL
jgi:hypothetical protein